MQGGLVAPSWTRLVAERTARAAPRERATTIAPVGAALADGATAYGLAALHAEVDSLATTAEGGRNHALNRSAFSLAQLVAAGHLQRHDTMARLRSTAGDIGLEPGEVEATLRSAFGAGERQPREVAQKAQALDEGTVSVVSLADIITPAPDQPEGGAETETEAETEARRTTWWPEPLIERAASESAAPEPTVLCRLDGQALLYSGKVNAILGESESGKSWIALLAALQAIEVGARVLFLDFEDSPSTIATRLRLLGATEVQLRGVDYANPDEALGVLAARDLSEAIDLEPYALAVIDGVNAAMTLLGLDLNSNTDATRFHTVLLRRIADAGPCVLTVDHVPKNAEARGKGGIGAQAKRAMISGSAITATVTEPFGKGVAGAIRLTIDKDRQGHVRGAAIRGTQIGTVHITPRGEGVEMTIDSPAIDDEGKPIDDFKPTRLMEKVSDFLEREQSSSRTQIRAGVTGKSGYIDKALDSLIDDGFVVREAGRNGGSAYRLVCVFREGMTPPRASNPDPDPTQTHPDPGLGPETQTPDPPPLGGLGLGQGPPGSVDLDDDEGLGLGPACRICGEYTALMFGECRACRLDRR